jgi:hypothetical protein
MSLSEQRLKRMDVSRLSKNLSETRTEGGMEQIENAIWVIKVTLLSVIRKHVRSAASFELRMTCLFSERSIPGGVLDAGFIALLILQSWSLLVFTYASDLFMDT